MCSDVLGNVCASNSLSGMARFILTPAPGVGLRVYHVLCSGLGVWV